MRLAGAVSLSVNESYARMRNEKLEIRNEGGGFAAIFRL